MTVGYLAFELRRMLRIRTLLALGTLLPLGIYLAISLSSNRSMSDLDRGIPLAGLLMISVAGIGVMLGVLSHGSGIAYERADGWLRLLRVTPVQPPRVVAVRGLVSSLTAIPPVVVVGMAAGLLHGLSLSPSRWVLVVAAMWLGAAPFALLGLALGFTLPREWTGPVTNLAWLMLALLGGLIVPVDSFPPSLRTISELTPAFRYAELGWRTMAGAAPTVSGTATMLGWTVLFALLAGWAYRRSSPVR